MQNRLGTRLIIKKAKGPQNHHRKNEKRQKEESMGVNGGGTTARERRGNSKSMGKRNGVR